MALRDDLGTALKRAGVNYNDLRIDKRCDQQGRESLQVGFIINGEAGPVMYDTWIANDVTLDQEVELVANNAYRHYANYAKEKA